MVERVAWAMAQLTGTGFRDMPEWARAEWLPRARLAIAAMREPSNDMVEAGSENTHYEVVDDDGSEYVNLEPERVTACWRAMIDAALQSSIGELPAEFEREMEKIMLAQAPMRAAERQAVRKLGDSIGYGNLMSTASDVWASLARANKTDGSNFVVGPCAAMVETCPHEFDASEKFLDKNGHCDWCCGSGWVTKRVGDAMRAV